MKRIAIIAGLVLAITASILSGTLANYNITLKDMATGSVVAKEFIFVEEGTNTFSQGVKIAPTETVNWQFAVRNYDDFKITETDLYYKLTLDIGPVEGKSAIEPLVVTIKDENGVTLKSIKGVGTINIYGDFMLDAEGQRSTYKVDIHWPSNPEIDIEYAGNNFGTKVNVSAIASQVPFDIDEEPGNGEEPGTGEEPGSGEDPENAIAEVIFKETSAWRDNNGTGPLRRNFQIHIKNLSDATIEKWHLKFTLAEGMTIDQYQSCRLQIDGNKYTFLHPNDHNIYIDMGETVSLTGHIIGETPMPMSDMTLNGHPVKVTYIPYGG